MGVARTRAERSSPRPANGRASIDGRPNPTERHDRTRRSDTTGATTEDGTTAETDGPPNRRLPPAVARDLRTVADRIDDYAETLPFGPARHHARKAAAAAREAADEDRPLVARRAAVGELVTELRTAADGAVATRTQYRLLEILYEEALPATRAAGTALY